MMKKIIYLVLSLTINQMVFAQTDSGKVVLGVPILAKSESISDANRVELSGVVQDQAGKIKNLKLVPRNSESMKAISDELSKITDPSSLNASVLADADKQSGATYLLVGGISKIDLTKKSLGTKNVLGLPVEMFARFVNIQTNMSVINVSTGQIDTTTQISSDMVPIEVIGGDSRAISAAFKLMGKKFNAFIQNWYNGKTGVTNTK